MAKDSYKKTGNKKGSSGSLIDEIPFDKYEKSSKFKKLRRGFKKGYEESGPLRFKLHMDNKRIASEKGDYQKGVAAGYSKALLESGNETSILEAIRVIGDAGLMYNKSARQNIKKGIERGIERGAKEGFGDKVFLNKAKELIQEYEKKSE